ncbi:membrane protein DedA with SNARE-associated domain [Antricoccus suffuscus]|uniref:Membrane protein DedA with SNARE-associated domain n=1 Tax=Antricoccus suffuscus TaxID=1629062 RepID=A0A2T1A2M8_9ACTN|nr:DedA family protein [Antricoccus suffuscus]PRZ42855.1 membrane protein DedA with SNARE-associated domain [Antricoccus suffuscus]
MSAPVLPGFLGTLAPVLQNYGYLAVGALVLIEDFGIPVPGETILIAAAVYAGAGQLNIVAVGLIGFAAAVLGDNIGYAIGHFGGRPLALRFGRYVFLTPKRLASAEQFFNKHGAGIIVVARFIEGLRQVNGIMAGIIKMSWRRFLIYNAIGAALWTGLWVSLGYLAGNHLTAIYHAIGRYSLYAVAGGIVLIVGLVIRHRLRRRKESDPSGGTVRGPSEQ